MEGASIEFAKSILKERGLKQTNARISAISNIYSYMGAMPYYTLHKSVGIERTTLYRTLNTLVEEAIVHKTKGKDNETYYALCGRECGSHGHSHQHIHFQCRICQKVTCENLNEKFSIGIPKYTIENVEINLQGVCPLCK